MSWGRHQAPSAQGRRPVQRSSKPTLHKLVAAVRHRLTKAQLVKRTSASDILKLSVYAWSFAWLKWWRTSSMSNGTKKASKQRMPFASICGPLQYVSDHPCCRITLFLQPVLEHIPPVPSWPRRLGQYEEEVSPRASYPVTITASSHKSESWTSAQMVYSWHKPMLGPTPLWTWTLFARAAVQREFNTFKASNSVQ